MIRTTINKKNLFRKNIIDKMFYCEVKTEEFIFKQGDNASSYFIIGIQIK